MSDGTDIQRLVPNPDRDSAEWWEALVRHEFVLQRCDACRAWRIPDVTPLPVSGSGIAADSPTMNQFSPHTLVVTYG